MSLRTAISMAMNSLFSIIDHFNRRTTIEIPFDFPYIQASNYVATTMNPKC